MLKEVTAWMQSPLLRLDGSTVILLALAHAPKSGTTDPQFLGKILFLFPGRKRGRGGIRLLGRGASD